VEGDIYIYVYTRIKYIVVRFALLSETKKSIEIFEVGPSSAENLGHLNVDHVHQQEKKNICTKKI
jgi:hypothetical protein